MEPPIVFPPAPPKQLQGLCERSCISLNQLYDGGLRDKNVDCLHLANTLDEWPYCAGISRPLAPDDDLFHYIACIELGCRGEEFTPCPTIRDSQHKRGNDVRGCTAGRLFRKGLPYTFVMNPKTSVIFYPLVDGEEDPSFTDSPTSLSTTYAPSSSSSGSGGGISPPPAPNISSYSPTVSSYSPTWSPTTSQPTFAPTTMTTPHPSTTVTTSPTSSTSTTSSTSPTPRPTRFRVNPPTITDYAPPTSPTAPTSPTLQPHHNNEIPPSTWIPLLVAAILLLIVLVIVSTRVVRRMSQQKQRRRPVPPNPVSDPALQSPDSTNSNSS